MRLPDASIATNGVPVSMVESQVETGKEYLGAATITALILPLIHCVSVVATRFELGPIGLFRGPHLSPRKAR